MNSKASRKVPDGKLVEIKVETRDRQVHEVEITGDFFLEPPEKLSELEEKMTDVDIDTSKEEIKENLNQIDADMIGFSPEDIAKVFQKAVKESDK